jgi:hypothetical protein
LTAQRPGSSRNHAQDDVRLAALSRGKGVLLHHARQGVGGYVRLEVVSGGEIEPVSTGGAGARWDKLWIIREVAKLSGMSDGALCLAPAAHPLPQPGETLVREKST